MSECVKCKDCKWFDVQYYMANQVPYTICNNPGSPLFYKFVKPDFGCVLGERKPITDTDELVERLR